MEPKQNSGGDEEQHQPLLSEGNVRSESETGPPRPPDGGWGWLVVLACFLTTFTLDGIGYSFGMLMEPLKSEMQEGNFGVASVGSIQIAVYLSSGPLVASLVTRFGARPVCITGSLLSCLGLLAASNSDSVTHLLVSYSLLAGLGFGLMYIPGVVAAQAHFTHRRALATGLAVCGTGVGTLVLPPLLELFIEQLGWRGALRCLAGICLASVLCGAAMFPARTEAAENKEEEEEQGGGAGEQRRDCSGWRFLLSLIVGRDLATSSSLGLFFIVMTGDFLATMSLYIPYTHLPDMAMARGVDPRDAAFLISSAGICSTVGRVVAGAVCDQGSLHPLTLTLTATALAASQSFLLALCSQYWQFLLLTSGFGLATGFWVACETPLIIRTLSFSCLTPAFGLLTAGGGVAALTGAPLAGSVPDHHYHYNYHYHYHQVRHGPLQQGERDGGGAVRLHHGQLRPGLRPGLRGQRQAGTQEEGGIPGDIVTLTLTVSSTSYLDCKECTLPRDRADLPALSCAAVLDFVINSVYTRFYTF